MENNNATAATMGWKIRLTSLSTWTDGVLFLGGAANIGIGTWAAYGSNATLAATALAAGLILLLAATIDRFESIKGLGIEAKTRKLDEKIVQADEALSRLRELTEMSCGALMEINSRIGRWTGPPEPRALFALVEEVRRIMRSAGSSDAAIRAAITPWARSVCADIAAINTLPLLDLLRSESEKVQKRRVEIGVTIPGSEQHKEFERLSSSMSAIGSLMDRIHNIRGFKLDDYPECFVSLFDNVPEVDPAAIDAMRKTAQTFAADMTTFKETLRIPDKESWLRELDKLMEKR